MRPALHSSALPALLLSALLAACAASPNAPARNVPQSGSLKVHPGLLGQPVPPELQPEAPAAPVAPPDESDKEAPNKPPADRKDQRSQRSIYFDYNSADIKAEFVTVLQAHARHLAQHPDAKLRIEGNADERGTAEHNRKLGQQRAEAVKQTLLGQGAADRQVKATTLGESKPRQKGHNEESWAENRRADILYEKE